MNDETVKYNITKSIIISISLFVMTFIFYSDEIIDLELNNFNLMTKELSEKKSDIILLSIASEYNLIYPNNEGVINKLDNKTDAFIYYLDDTKLSDNELSILNTMKVVTKVIPNILDKEQYILYYRSYSGNKIFTLKDISRFNLTKDVFSDESCRLSVCTINTSHESLNDKVVISSIYSGSVTGADVITLSSPVYHNNEIIGDFTLNFYIDTTFLKDKKIDIYKKGHNKIISISNTGYILSSFYFVKEFIADNQTTFLYKVPFMKSVFDFIWIFFLLLLISYYSFHKISELHDKKTKLKNIESTINIDELTGAYNRKVLKDVSLQHFLEQKSTSLISIDGDNLKYINDNFGHHVGDAAIKQIVNGIRMTFRESDYFIRTGGDEFLVVLPNCELETANLLAKKVKENVCSTVFSDHAITISVSIGVTQIRENEMIDSALKRVDELLYEDKR